MFLKFIVLSVIALILQPMSVLAVSLPTQALYCEGGIQNLSQISSVFLYRINSNSPSDKSDEVYLGRMRSGSHHWELGASAHLVNDNKALYKLSIKNFESQEILNEQSFDALPMSIEMMIDENKRLFIECRKFERPDFCRMHSC